MLQALLRLLVVEAFAGTYPVARVAQHLNNGIIKLGARVDAYVGIELSKTLAHRAPGPNQLGVHREHYLNFTGKGLSCKAG